MSFIPIRQRQVGPGAVRGDGGKAKAIPPDAIGPARFPSARLIEANRHHARGVLSGAADRFPSAQGGFVVDLSSGRKVTIPQSSVSSVTFTADFRIAVPHY
jgi:hypothetical protein